MEVSYEGLAGEPGFQFGTFLENYYGVEDAHIFPDELTVLSIGTVLCRREFIAISVEAVSNTFASMHDEYRAAGRLPERLLDQSAFLMRLSMLADVRSGSELSRRLTHPVNGPPPPAKRRAFERAVAGQFLNLVESTDVIGIDEDVCSAKRDTVTGERYVASQYGMRVRLPENNGEVIAFMPGMGGARKLAKECAQGVWQGATLLDDSHFLRHAGRLYATRERVSDKVTARDDGIREGGAEIIRNLAYDQSSGFDAALLVNLHAMDRPQMLAAVERSPAMLGDRGLLVVSGHNHFPRTHGVDVGDALLALQDAYGDPTYLNTYSLEAIGEAGYGQEAVFVKAGC